MTDSQRSSMTYLPVSQRYADRQYQNLIATILTNGVEVPTQQGPPALTLMQQTMQFNLTNGFPLITDRNMTRFWQKPIAELCAFINGAVTLKELVEFGCTWWGPWATPAKTSTRNLPAGHLGPGSYGGAFHDFPGPYGESFDQFKHLVEQINELPDLRTHFVSPWIPQYQIRGNQKIPQATIAPCHGWVHVRILNGGLHLHMFQRSGDVPVGVPSNMVQYAALLLMLEHLTNYRATTFYHTISDAHIYADQISKIKIILKRPVRRLPTVQLTDAGRAIGDIHDFRAEHFVLSDYNPHPAIGGIPVAP